MLVIRLLDRSEREDAVRLLAVQLAEHDIEIADDALSEAIDGLYEREGRGFLLVALDRELSEKPLGIAYLSYQWSLEYGGQIAWLEELYVLPEHREKGIGSKLLDASIAELQMRGCRAIDLEIEKGHERVASLYLRTGFKQMTRVRYSKRLTS